MVIRRTNRRRERGSLIAELLVAITILAVAVYPIGYSILSERMAARASYEHAVAMEIVDGELEILAAGQWRQLPPGTTEYNIHANAARNLPDGKFLVTIQPGKVRLEWRPDGPHHGGPILREAVVK